MGTGDWGLGTGDKNYFSYLLITHYLLLITYYSALSTQHSLLTKFFLRKIALNPCSSQYP
ncbi:hypothetical protein [Nostoc sp. CMAA1605]|uniref:hypothetical protein n=1 Tax=Nostoc sp. CMAA1605 TaxID=2055159 RepID=UPI001F4840F1|nr:hypothetical protein [Nostoc sp. CMAA1605]